MNADISKHILRFINELVGSGSVSLGHQAKLEETGIFLVMSFELLGGSQKIRGGGQLRRRLEKKKKILLKAFKDAGPVFGDGKVVPFSKKIIMVQNTTLQMKGNAILYWRYTTHFSLNHDFGRKVMERFMNEDVGP